MKEDILGTVQLPETEYNLMESIIIRLGKDTGMTGNRVIDFPHTILGGGSRNEINSRLESLGFAGTSIIL